MKAQFPLFFLKHGRSGCKSLHPCSRTINQSWESTSGAGTPHPFRFSPGPPPSSLISASPVYLSLQTPVQEMLFVTGVPSVNRSNKATLIFRYKDEQSTRFSQNLSEKQNYSVLLKRLTYPQVPYFLSAGLLKSVFPKAKS